jgi:deoxyribodipyrimidine photo-lyase
VPRSVHWFRRDLRLADNPALTAATEGADQVVPLFVLDPRITTSPRMSPARLQYLCDALADLQRRLEARGSRLVLRRGDPRVVVPQVAREANADAVHWCADHSAYAQDRDRAVRSSLREAGIEDRPAGGVAIHDPRAVRSRSGEVFRVFSPFHRAWQEVRVGDPLPPPDRIPPTEVTGEPLPTPEELGIEVDPGLPEGGEAAGRRRLDDFLATRAAAYREARNLLGADGTSRLSADLHYGCVSAREAYRRADRRKPGHDTFAKELVWRDFYLHVMAAWPEVAQTEFNPAMRSLPWRGESAEVDAWRDGRTGFPIVDAAMRQLRTESWMHNRARMVVASFLCKDLLVDWRIGEAHFLRHLVDGDIASNNGGWQWAAGTGTDPQPFFRIFNPVLQGEKFDPEGTYVRRYVPELRPVPDRWLHKPWEMPAEVAEGCGVRIGVHYPEPIVDHAEARREALAWFEAHKR